MVTMLPTGNTCGGRHRPSGPWIKRGPRDHPKRPCWSGPSEQWLVFFHSASDLRIGPIAVIMVLAGSICFFFLLPISQFPDHHAARKSSCRRNYPGASRPGGRRYRHDSAGAARSTGGPRHDLYVVIELQLTASAMITITFEVGYFARYRRGRRPEPRGAGVVRGCQRSSIRPASRSRSRNPNFVLIVNLTSPDSLRRSRRTIELCVSPDRRSA